MKFTVFDIEVLCVFRGFVPLKLTLFINRLHLASSLPCTVRTPVTDIRKLIRCIVSEVFLFFLMLIFASCLSVVPVRGICQRVFYNLFRINRIFINSLVFSPRGRSGRSQSPVMEPIWLLAHCILGKFLGVVCLCFPPPLDFPTFAATCLCVRSDARDLSRQRWARKMSGSNFA